MIQIKVGVRHYAFIRYAKFEAGAMTQVPLDSERSLSARTRHLITSAFEVTCIGLVVIPTAIAALLVIVAIFQRDYQAALGLFFLMILTFVVTAFLAGGALTLISISVHAHEVARILQRIEKEELRPIADDVHRLESIGEALPQTSRGPAPTPH